MKCPRCGGYGIIEKYKYVEGGRCFLCEGSGKIAAREYSVYSQTENKKAHDREKRIQEKEKKLAEQKELHQKRLQNGYYQKKAEEEKQRREAMTLSTGKSAAQCLNEFFDEFFKIIDE